MASARRVKLKHAPNRSPQLLDIVVPRPALRLGDSGPLLYILVTFDGAFNGDELYVASPAIEQR